jgi:hypothetical protein
LAGSLQLTSAYRRRLLSLEAGVGVRARSLWPRIEDFDGTSWPEQIAALVTRAQTESVRASNGYLTALLRTNRKPGRLTLDTRRYAGVSRDGRPIAEALESALIGTRAALKQGREPRVALSIGLSRGLRMARFETMQAARDSLLDAVQEDDRFTGWQRSVSGTCAACMALSGTTGPKFEVHPSCQCVPLPTISGVAKVALPTGAALFAALSTQEQEAKIGADAAALVRSGEADLNDFVSHSHIETQQDFITQKPAQEVATNGA